MWPAHKYDRLLKLFVCGLVLCDVLELLSGRGATVQHLETACAFYIHLSSLTLKYQSLNGKKDKLILLFRVFIN